MSAFKPGQNKAPNPNGGVTFIAGLLAAFFLTGPIYNATIVSVTEFAWEQYGSWGAWITELAWLPVCAGGLLFGFRILADVVIEQAKFQFNLWQARRRF